MARRRAFVRPCSSSVQPCGTARRAGWKTCSASPPYPPYEGGRRSGATCIGEIICALMSKYGKTSRNSFGWLVGGEQVCRDGGAKGPPTGPSIDECHARVGRASQLAYKFGRPEKVVLPGIFAKTDHYAVLGTHSRTPMLLAEKIVRR